jgi:hypothetical protein
MVEIAKTVGHKSMLFITLSKFKDREEQEEVYFLIKDMLEDKYANANRP